jgi:hypothetical protein
MFAHSKHASILPCEFIYTHSRRFFDAYRKHPKNTPRVIQFLAALGYQSEALTQSIIEFGGLKLLGLALREALSSRSALNASCIDVNGDLT